MLIYQDDIGGTNIGKTPKGGVIVLRSVASSMATTITNPIIYYGGYSAVINQSGHSGDLYNYYWTSYSRGTDGEKTNANWHNAYLDGYIPLRVKSIYDPCPYLYRIPSNGTWNQFNIQSGWTWYSYLGGASWNLNTLGESWFISGRRNAGSSVFEWTGSHGFYFLSTTSGQTTGSALGFAAGGTIQSNRNDDAHSFGHSVRCIERRVLK